jgi:hypothetical protein
MLKNGRGRRLVPGYPPSMKRGLRCADLPAVGARLGGQYLRDVAGRPWTSKPRCRESSGIERPGDHRLRGETATLKPPHDAPRLLGRAGIKHRANAHRRRRVRPAMPSHQQIKVVRCPSPTNGPDALGKKLRRRSRSPRSEPATLITLGSGPEDCAPRILHRANSRSHLSPSGRNSTQG